jgi:hypothetical protein
VIGNYEDAARALAAFRERDFSYALSDFGSTRVVYLINDVVYKVEREDEDSKDANLYEIENMLKGIPEGLPIRFPKASLFEVDGANIIAMEYIEGEEIGRCNCTEWEPHTKSCMTIDEIRLLTPLNYDYWGLNTIRTNDGIYYIIDAAF